MARDYIRQSLDGPPTISFLPAYYAILNLMKVYVLLGRRHADLSSHRWHGATYDISKSSHSILTEIVVLKQGGAFPLFYETLTGTALTSDVPIQMKDVLSYVSGIGHEYYLATGQVQALVILRLGVGGGGAAGHPTADVHSARDGKVLAVDVRDLRVLKGFRAIPGQPGNFLCKNTVDLTKDLGEEMRQHLRTHLIYRVTPRVLLTPACARRLELPEELPIAILFFYMSSVVRYKPDFFHRLQDSKFWPLLAAARVHSFYRFLLAFWSFMRQENYFVTPD